MSTVDHRGEQVACSTLAVEFPRSRPTTPLPSPDYSDLRVEGNELITIGRQVDSIARNLERLQTGLIQADYCAQVRTSRQTAVILTSAATIAVFLYRPTPRLGRAGADA